MFCFMPVPPWTVDGHVRWGCRNSHEDWREDAGDNSKHNSLTGGKRNNSHDLHVSIWNLFGEYSWLCSHFNSELFGELFGEGISEGRQLDHSGENSEVFGSCHSSKLQEPHGEQGILAYMVYNIHAQNREKCFLPKRLEEFSLTSSTSRTIPCNVCENFLWFWESRCYENNVCTCKLTHLFIHEDDDIVHVHCRSNHSSQSLTLPFSQCCGNADVQTRWSLQNQSLDDKILLNQVSALRPLLWVSGFSRHNVDLKFNEEVLKPERFKQTLDHAGFNPDTMRVSANGTKDDSWGWRFTLLIFQSHKWHFCWNKFDVRKRVMKKGSPWR